MELRNTERDCRARMGEALYDARLLKERTREKRLGGLITWCPMRILRPFALFFFRITGLYRWGHRQYLALNVREEHFFLPGLAPCFDRFTLLQLSDLHLDLSEDFVDVLRSTLAQLKEPYDAVCITGDINNYTLHKESKALQLLEGSLPLLKAPCYAVLGNHDSVDDIPVLEKMGVRVLLNEGICFSRTAPDGTAAHLVLAGIDDPNIFKTHNLNAALAVRSAPETPSVLLSHAPSIAAEAARHGVSLVLSGHVHGGQICRPDGKIVNWSRWKFPRHLWRGRWKHASTQGYTSTGAGACGIPFRAFCPPEIVRIILHPKENP